MSAATATASGVRERHRGKSDTDEDQRRMKRAADRMAELGIVRDTRTKENSGKRMCTVCGKLWKQFTIMVEDEVIPHQIITKGQQGPQFRFCPLADDHSLYHQHEERKRSGVANRVKKHRASK